MLHAYAFARVAHVGTFPAAPPTGRRSASLEGIDLSVSVHPQEWIRIAQLGGFPVRTLVRGDGQPGQFLDWYSARPEIEAWGLDTGNAARVPSYAVTWEDDETEEDVSFTFLDRRSAEAEAVDREVEVITGVTLREAGNLAQRLASAFGRTSADQSHRSFEGELANRFVVATRPDLDGVWWADNLNVAAYSAPRGIIVPEALSRWLIGAEGWR